MYPETDIPPTQITEDLIKKASLALPELPEQKLQRLMKDYGLNQKLARQILDSENSELFETIIKESSVSPTTVAAFLTETLRALKRDGVEVDKVSENQIREIFKSISTGKLTKEALSDVVVWLSQHEDKSVEEAINNLGLKIVPESELKTFIEKVIADNEKLIKERGESSFGILMGIVMKSMRGKIDAVLVSKVLKEKLKELLN